MRMNYHIDDNTDLLPLTIDAVVKSIFTRDDPAARIALMDFLSVIIGRKVIEVRILNNEPASTDVTQLQERLDINCKFNNSDYADVEMQLYPKNLGIEGYISRVEYYACDLFSSQGVKGLGYPALAKVYQITIANFTAFEHRKQMINHFQFRNDEGETLSDNAHIYFIELTKLRDVLTKPIEEMTPVEMWAVFLKFADDKNKRELLNKIIEAREGIQMAVEMLSSISKDEHERARMLSRMKFWNDYESDVICAEKKAREENSVEIARKMLREKDSIEKISRITELPLATIQELAQSTQQQ